MTISLICSKIEIDNEKYHYTFKDADHLKNVFYSYLPECTIHFTANSKLGFEIGKEYSVRLIIEAYEGVYHHESALINNRNER